MAAQSLERQQQPNVAETDFDGDDDGAEFGDELEDLFETTAEKGAQLVQKVLITGLRNEFRGSIEKMKKRVSPRKVKRARMVDGVRCKRVYRRGDRAGQQCENDANDGCEATRTCALWRGPRSRKRHRSLTTDLPATPRTTAPTSTPTTSIAPNAHREQTEETALDSRRLRLMEPATANTEPEPVNIAPLDLAQLENEPAPKKPRQEPVDLAQESNKEQSRPLSKEKVMEMLMGLFDAITK
jgi:hypothetical protein